MLICWTKSCYSWASLGKKTINEWKIKIKLPKLSQQSTHLRQRSGTDTWMPGTMKPWQQPVILNPVEHAHTHHWHVWRSSGQPAFQTHSRRVRWEGSVIRVETPVAWWLRHTARLLTPAWTALLRSASCKCTLLRASVGKIRTYR